MKHNLISLLVVGLFAGVTTSAIGQNFPSETRTNTDAALSAQESATNGESADVSMPAQVAKIDASDRSDQYKVAEAQAQTDYTEAKMKCDSLKEVGAMRNCMQEATKIRTAALAQAEMQRDNPGKTSAADTKQPGSVSTIPVKPATAPAK